jgi:hypothetical protein
VTLVATAGDAHCFRVVLFLSLFCIYFWSCAFVFFQYLPTHSVQKSVSYQVKARVKVTRNHNDQKKSLARKPIPCYHLFPIPTNFDGDSILFDDSDAATPSLHTGVRVLVSAHNTSIESDIRAPQGARAYP